MSILKAENRDLNLKVKKLRREGIVPGILYGKNLEEPLSIQFAQKEAAQFLKSNAIGSKTELVIGENKMMALLKEVTYTPVINHIEHLSFQTLIPGEKITGTAQVILLNKDKISETVQQSEFEISYRALPSDLVEKIEIDLEGMKVGDSIRVGDLELAKNEAVEILNPPDSLVVSIAARNRSPYATPETVKDAE